MEALYVALKASGFLWFYCSHKHLQIKSAIRAICEKENVEVPESLLDGVVKKAGRNMRRAVLMIEAAKLKRQSLLLMLILKPASVDE